MRRRKFKITLKCRNRDKYPKDDVIFRSGDFKRNLGIKVKREHWDTERDNVNLDCPNFDEIHYELEELKRRIKRIMDDDPDLTIQEVWLELENKNNKTGIIEYCDQRIEKFREQQRFGNIGSYNNFKGSFKKCFKNWEKLELRHIKRELVDDYRQYLINRNLSHSSIRNYLSTLRALMNHAIDSGKLKRPAIAPFKGMITKPKSKPRVLTFEMIQKIRELELKEGTATHRAQQIFLFCFNCQGMSLVDAFSLKASVADKKVFSYRRRKQRGYGEDIDVHVTEEAQKIMQYFKDKGENGFLFPILREDINASEKAYKHFKGQSKNFRDDLKAVGKMAGIENITSYMTRYSWGTLAIQAGHDIFDIQTGYGHTNPFQTAEYIKHARRTNMLEINENVSRGRKYVDPNSTEYIAQAL